METSAVSRAISLAGDTRKPSDEPRSQSVAGHGRGPLGAQRAPAPANHPRTWIIPVSGRSRFRDDPRIGTIPDFGTIPDPGRAPTAAAGGGCAAERAATARARLWRFAIESSKRGQPVPLEIMREWN